jgi:hypothetical protein
MPSDEELVKLARRYPAFKHHLQNPNAPFTTPAPDIEYQAPDTPVDDHGSTPEELREMFPAIRSRDYEAQKAATEAAYAAQEKWDQAHRLR